MEFDEILNHIGGTGRYQVFIFIVTSLINWPYAFDTLLVVFSAATPRHWCYEPQLDYRNLSVEEIRNLSIPRAENNKYDSCHMFNLNYTNLNHDRNLSNLSITSCKYGWTYDTSIFKNTLVTDWNMVCERRWLSMLFSSSFMLGLFFGAPLSGLLSDKFGRKKTLIIAILGKCVISISFPFMYSLTLIIFWRFCLGIFSIALLNIAYINRKFKIWY